MSTWLSLSLTANLVLLGLLAKCVHSYRDMEGWAREKRQEAEKLSDNLGSKNIELAQALDRIAKMELALEPESSSKTALEYAVNGTPRHVPWHIRRKQKEAEARTKRKHLESFTELT